MKNSLIFLLLCLPAALLSQNKLENKLSVAYDINYFPATIADEHTEGFPVGARIKYAHKEHTISLNYKLKTRISATVFGGFMANKATALERGNYYKSDTGLGSIHSVSFGAGINFHLKSGYAPSGNSFGFYIRQHNMTITNENVKDVFRDKNYLRSEFGGIDSKDFKLNVTYIGAKYNYTHMLFKKLPLYVNAGIGLYIPVLVNVSSPNYERKKEIPGWFDSHEQNELKLNENIEELTTFYKRLNIFRLNIGIAYCF